VDFSAMDIATLTRSVTGEGVRYLELFLKEYVSLFGGPVNPSCPKCLTEYLLRYKNHHKTMENPSKYRLHARYENIPLEFGSPILVNNSNITDAYALKLLEQKNGERYFIHIPEKPATIAVQAAQLKKAVKKATRVKKKEPAKDTISDNSEATLSNLPSE